MTKFKKTKWGLTALVAALLLAPIGAQRAAAADPASPIRWRPGKSSAPPLSVEPCPRSSTRSRKADIGYFLGVAADAGDSFERNWSAVLFNWLKRKSSVENSAVLLLEAA